MQLLSDQPFQQNKIRVEQADGLRGASSPIPESYEESAQDAAAKLIDGVQINDDGDEEIENERPRKSINSTRRANARTRSVSNSGSSIVVPATNQTTTNGLEEQQNDDSVFKSASWLSESELIFSLTNQVGGLVRALRVFQELDIGIKHVESRKSKRRDSEFEIFVDIDCSDRSKMRKLVHHLR